MTHVREQAASSSTHGAIPKVWAALSLLVLLVTTCTAVVPTQGAASSATGQRFGGTLRVALCIRCHESPAEHLRFLDPQRPFIPNSAERELLRCCLLRTLLSYNGRPADEGGIDPRPDLAEDMPEISDDGLTWTFHLRTGIRYAPPLEQMEVTAPDIIRALERYADPKIGQDEALSMFSVIQGFDDFAKHATTSISGLEAPDAYTLEVHLTHVANDLGYRFALSATAPIPPNPAGPAARFGVAEGHDDGYGRFLVASGPYMIKGAEDLDFTELADVQTPLSGLVIGRGRNPIRSLTLVRNPSWDRRTDALRKAYVDVIVVHVKPLEEAARAIDGGSLDLILDAPNPPEQLARYRSAPRLSAQVHEQPSNNVSYAVMRLPLPPFDDIHVRRAVNYAFNAAEANRISSSHPYGGSGYVLSTPSGHIAPDSAEDDLLQGWTPYPFDPERAGEEMALSRYDHDRDGVCDDPACRHIRTIDTNLGPEPLTESVWRRDLKRIGITLDIHRLGILTFLRRTGDPRSAVPLNIGPWWEPDLPGGSTLFPTVVGSAGIGGFPYSNFSLMGARANQLDGWGYGVTSVPSVDTEIQNCLSLLAFEQHICWARLDQLLMLKVVPWIPWFNAFQARVVSARVVRFSFDQAIGALPALDQIAVASDAG